MKLAIIGSRNLKVDNIGQYLPDNVTEIVSGGARGIDRCAREYALENGIRLTEFLPEYNRYGKGAPLRRNLDIIEYADAVLAFWDGESHGTGFVIKRCKMSFKKLFIVYKDELPGYEPENANDGSKKTKILRPGIARQTRIKTAEEEKPAKNGSKTARGKKPGNISRNKKSIKAAISAANGGRKSSGRKRLIITPEMLPITDPDSERKPKDAYNADIEKIKKAVIISEKVKGEKAEKTTKKKKTGGEESEDNADNT